jgi:hypothetical protein
MSSYIEYSFIDKDVVRTGKINEIITKVKADKKLHHLINSITLYSNATRFKCDNYDQFLIN